MNSFKPNLIVVHPLVLLQVVDHYNRIVTNQESEERVLGVLLGQYEKNSVVDISNSYAIPFEEDPKDERIWFIDHNFHEEMYSMHRKVNLNEVIVGWYTTGTKVRNADIQINQLFRKYCPNAVLLVIDVKQDDPHSLPTEGYFGVETITKTGETVKTLMTVPTTVEALDIEEIAIEHLLREIKDNSPEGLSIEVQTQINSLRGMSMQVNQIKRYLQLVNDEKIYGNQDILRNIQELLNHLPRIDSQDFRRAINLKNNDSLFTIYTCALTRSIISLHTLINNKLDNREFQKNQEKEKLQKKEQKKEEKQDQQNDKKKN